jgi:uncharacterized protein YndB with AHSA1/START domain
MEWQRTFELRAPIGRVWAAFVETPPTLTWNGMVPGASLDPMHSIDWPDRDEDIDAELSMQLTFTETDTGTRLTLTRSGFGEGDMFEVRQTSKLVAWGEAMHDLAVYLETGIDLRRLHRSHPDHPISATGAQLREVLGGLLVTSIQPRSFAELAGLEVGDLVVRLAGVPVFDRGDLWLLARLTAPGTETTVQFVRGTELREASAPMSPIDLWATGELGGGPRE